MGKCVYKSYIVPCEIKRQFANVHMTQTDPSNSAKLLQTNNLEYTYRKKKVPLSFLYKVWPKVLCPKYINFGHMKLMECKQNHVI